MRPVFILALLGLAACATPQQACIANAGKEIKVIDGLIATTRANLARGYAVDTKQVLVNTEQVCGVTPEGDEIYCDVAVAEKKRVPVAIDLDAEKRKLESLLQRRAEMDRLYQAQVNQCIAQYPES